MLRRFNGQMFTANLPPEGPGRGPTMRDWGANSWWQNTRLTCEWLRNPLLLLLLRRRLRRRRRRRRCVAIGPPTSRRACCFPRPQIGPWPLRPTSTPSP